MTKEPYEEGLDIFRDSEADEDFRAESGDLTAEPNDGQTGTQYPAQGAGQTGFGDPSSSSLNTDQDSESAAMGLDDDLNGSAYESTSDASGTAGSDAALGAAGAAGGVAGYGASGTYAGGSGGTGGAVAKAGDVAGSAASKASDVAGSAADKAAEIKDVAVERGGDVAAVAKDELARLAQEARSEVQSLWSNASEQLRGQAATGQQQLSELLHSLAGELGEMASKSDNTGPLTALAKQAAARGGEWSHWLANSEPTDVLTEVRRFARRRPFVFLASAALAGVVVGRLSRGLMAANDTEHTATRMVGGSPDSVPATPGVTTPPAVTYEEVPSFGEGEAPEQMETYSSQASSANPYGLNDGSAR